VSDVVVRAATEADRHDWDAYLTRRAGDADVTGYHEWAWQNVIRDAFGHEAVYLIARRSSDGAVAGVLPLVFIKSRLFGRTLTSMPFLNYGGVAADDDSISRALIQQAAAQARLRQCKSAELRHFDRRFPELPCRQHKVTMRLPLGAVTWETLDRKVRNQVRKAQKSELSVEDGGIELVPAFYHVFARNMRDLGTPVYSRRWFELVMTAFPDRTRLAVVRLKGEPIAAALTYRTGPTVEVPWASSIRDHNALCPNHLMYWHMLQSAQAVGAEVFDFGRSTPGEGTYKFKEQWGATAVPLTWEYCFLDGAAVPDASPANPKYRMAIDLWKHFPLWLANVVGPRIVRDIP